MPLARRLASEGGSPAGRVGNRGDDIHDGEREALHEGTEIEILDDIGGHSCESRFVSAWYESAGGRNAPYFLLDILVALLEGR